jgi:hypothetical protein
MLVAKIVKNVSLQPLYAAPMLYNYQQIAEESTFCIRVERVSQHASLYIPLLPFTPIAYNHKYEAHSVFNVFCLLNE